LRAVKLHVATLKKILSKTTVFVHPLNKTKFYNTKIQEASLKLVLPMIPQNQYATTGEYHSPGDDEDNF